MVSFPNTARIALAAGVLAFGCAAAASGRLRPAASPVDTNDYSEEDFQSVKAVCSRCHGLEMFMNNPRTWNRWNEVFARMSAHGARPTEQQVDHIVRYFLANLTYVNVNSASADELSLALGVSDTVAKDIVERRDKRKFRDLADLCSMPGVDAEILEKRKARIQF